MLAAGPHANYLYHYLYYTYNNLVKTTVYFMELHVHISAGNVRRAIELLGHKINKFYDNYNNAAAAAAPAAAGWLMMTTTTTTIFWGL